MSDLALARAAMADRLAAAGFPSAIVAAMRAVPRHDFVPGSLWRLAYAETDLWLGAGSLPAPAVVARTMAALAPHPGERVLEVGTGCGYLTALLAELGAEVFTIEPAGGYDLAGAALAGHPPERVHRSLGGDARAWAEAAPFDAILLNAPAAEPPADLLAQLAPDGGRLVAVIGRAPGSGRLTIARRHADGAVTLEDAGLVPQCSPPLPMPSGLGLSVPLEGRRTEP